MSRSDDEVLVRVEGVSKKFCRSLKKSLWYGVCDIARELLPVGKRRGARDEGRELSDRSAQDISRSTQDTGLSTAAASSSDARLLDTGLPRLLPQLSPLVLPSVGFPAQPLAPGVSTPSALALDSRLSTLDSTHGLRAGEFWAVRDVSFELRRGECLGLIGHNGAGNQAAGQPLGRLPQAARRVRRRGKARINTTLLKMLKGLIKPDSGSITMRGRVASWIMQKTPQANGAHLHSLPATLYLSQRRRRPLGLTKMELQ